jgi:hypothetical protein
MPAPPDAAEEAPPEPDELEAAEAGEDEAPPADELDAAEEDALPLPAAAPPPLDEFDPESPHPATIPGIQIRLSAIALAHFDDDRGVSIGTAPRLCVIALDATNNDESPRPPAQAVFGGHLSRA